MMDVEWMIGDWPNLFIGSSICGMYKITDSSNEDTVGLKYFNKGTEEDFGYFASVDKAKEFVRGK